MPGKYYPLKTMTKELEEQMIKVGVYQFISAGRVCLAYIHNVLASRQNKSALIRGNAFYAQCIARLSHRLGVRLFVCLPLSLSVSKRCKLGSRNLHCGLAAPKTVVLVTKFRAPG